WTVGRGQAADRTGSSACEQRINLSRAAADSFRAPQARQYSADASSATAETSTSVAGFCATAQHCADGQCLARSARYTEEQVFYNSCAETDRASETEASGRQVENHCEPA